MLSKCFEPAINKEKALNTLEIQLSKSGDTEFKIKKADIKIKFIPFIKVSQINEIRRNLTSKLRKIRRKNYNYNYRKLSFVTTEYPVGALDYRANIFNEKAELFYKKRGCAIQELALETQKNIKDKEVMISKYCIKNQLGLCPKQNPVKKYSEPFVLIDEFNKEYLVEFSCKECVMKIKVRD